MITNFKLKSNDLRNIDIIRNWIDERELIEFKHIPFKIRETFEEIANSEMIIFKLKETYGYNNKISFINRNNQIVILNKIGDNENKHNYINLNLDGYNYFLPSFISHIRIIIGLDDGNDYRKNFAMLSANNSTNKIDLKKGIVVAYDYNRDLNYSTFGNNNYLIKINYLIYPEWASFCNNYDYDCINNRNYYLKKRAIGLIDYYFGFSNLLYCYLFIIISIICRTIAPFFYATSFIHYCRYINERNRDLILFTRDFRFYNYLSKIELNYLYYFYFYDCDYIYWFHLNSLILLFSSYYKYDSEVIIMELLLFHNFNNHWNLFIFFHFYCSIILFMLNKHN